MSGERHAINLYEKALNEDLSTDFAKLVQSHVEMFRTSLLVLEELMQSIRV